MSDYRSAVTIKIHIHLWMLLLIMLNHVHYLTQGIVVGIYVNQDDFWRSDHLTEWTCAQVYTDRCLNHLVRSMVPRAGLEPATSRSSVLHSPN